MSCEPAPSAIERAFQVTTDWSNTPADAWVKGRAVMQTETRIPFRGWKMISFTTYDSVRERVNAVLALVIMGFAILLAAAFYLLSRRARVESAAYMRESADLRALNARLSREIAEREKVQKDLAVAEQTLELRRVLRGRDDEDFADTRKHERRQRVVDHRLVVDRHELLADALGDRV